LLEHLKDCEDTAKRDLQALQGNRAIQRPTPKALKEQDRRIKELTDQFDAEINPNLYEYLQRFSNFFEPANVSYQNVLII
jgi:hypothetical protein